MTRRPSRRAVLAGLGAAAVAGCLTDADDASADRTPTPDDYSARSTSSPSTTRPPTTGGTGASASPTDTPTPRGTGSPTTTGTVPEPPASVDSAWPVPGADAGRSNFAPAAAGPTDPVAELWRVAVDATLSQPVVADGTVFAGGSDGSVRALDARSGAERWQASVGDAAGTPRVVDGRVFVPAGQELAALDPADGTELWRTETLGRRGLLVAPHGVYWLDEGGPDVVALAGADGSERWRTTIGDPWAPVVFASDASVFVSSGTRDNRFWTLAADTGEITRAEPRSGNDFPAEQCYVDGTVYAVDGFFGSVRATGVGDGATGWSQGVGPAGDAGDLSGGPGHVYYTSNAEEPNLSALSAGDGTVAWERPPAAPPTGRPVVAAETVLVPTTEGVQCLDPDEGTDLWGRPDPDVGDRFVVADDLVYAADGGTLRAVRAP